MLSPRCGRPISRSVQNVWGGETEERLKRRAGARTSATRRTCPRQYLSDEAHLYLGRQHWLKVAADETGGATLSRPFIRVTLADERAGAGRGLVSPARRRGVRGALATCHARSAVAIAGERPWLFSTRCVQRLKLPTPGRDSREFAPISRRVGMWVRLLHTRDLRKINKHRARPGHLLILLDDLDPVGVDAR